MNKFVIIAGFVVAGTGILNAVLKKTSVTSVIIGAYVFVLLLALLDMFGGQLAEISNALAMLAVVYILLTEFPWVQIVEFAQTGKIKAA